MKLAFGFKKSKPKVAVQLEDDLNPESPAKKPKIGEHSSAHAQSSDLSRPTPVPDVIAATASTIISESEADRFGTSININNEVRKAAVKLAEYVAKNGRSFEDVTRDRNPGDSPFSFLYHKDCNEYRFYQLKIAEISAALGIQQETPTHADASSSPHAPLPPQPHIADSHLQHAPPWQLPPQSTHVQQQQHEREPEHRQQQHDHPYRSFAPPPPWQHHQAPFAGGQEYAGTAAPPWQQQHEQPFQHHDGYHHHVGGGAPWHQQPQQQQQPPQQRAGREMSYTDPSPSTGRASVGGGGGDWRPGEDSRGATDRGRSDHTSSDERAHRESSDFRDFAREPSRGHRSASGERRGRSFREQPSADKANAPKSPARLAAEEAEAAGDTTALMNYYMNKAADKRQSRDREPQVDPREMPPRADPRESRHGRSHGKRARASGGMAPNGGRAHHMGHHIPKEEMEKFYHQCDSANNPDSAKKPWQDNSNKISSNNKGYGLLAKMGWTEGAGLGAGGSGMVDPVSAGDVKTEKRGLGAAKSTSEVQEGDDIYEQYKKRMMLGYKHRPNPLGNPRKQYY